MPSSTLEMMRAEARKPLQKDQKEDTGEGSAEEAESPGELLRKDDKEDAGEGPAEEAESPGELLRKDEKEDTGERPAEEAESPGKSGKTTKRTLERVRQKKPKVPGNCRPSPTRSGKDRPYAKARSHTCANMPCVHAQKAQKGNWYASPWTPRADAFWRI